MPTQTTLKKYGLTEEEWVVILAAQGGVCPICGRVPSTGRWVTDHEHVRGFKKMKPEERKKYVRGITDWYCNATFLGRTMTIDKAKNMVAYLTNYERKKNEPEETKVSR